MRICFAVLAACLIAGPAFSQTQGTQSNGRAMQPGDQAAQSSPQNAAIKDPSRNNADNPVTGKNSFTEAQAKSRIEAKGYTNLSQLQLDNQGVWRGTATKNGQSGPVSLDYQGNVN